MARRYLLLALFGGAAACGLSVTGLEATSSLSPEAGAPGSSSGGNADTAGGDDDDGGLSQPVVLDSGGAPIVDAGQLFDGGTTTPDASTCNNKAVVFYDDGDQASGDGLVAFMLANGFASAVDAPLSTYQGGGGAIDPNANGVIVLLTARQIPSEMPAAGQSAIADRVTAGGGFVTEEWTTYDVANGNLKTLAQFTLATSQDPYQYFDGSKVALSFTDKRFWEGPGANNRFTTSAKLPFGDVNVRSGVTTNATTTGSHPVVLSVERGATRIAQTMLAVNDLSVNDNALTTDNNVRTLFNNMALWAAHCRP